MYSCSLVSDKGRQNWTCVDHTHHVIEWFLYSVMFGKTNSVVTWQRQSETENSEGFVHGAYTYKNYYQICFHSLRTFFRTWCVILPMSYTCAYPWYLNCVRSAYSIIITYGALNFSTNRMTDHSTLIQLASRNEFACMLSIPIRKLSQCKLSRKCQFLWFLLLRQALWRTTKGAHVHSCMGTVATTYKVAWWSEAITLQSCRWTTFVHTRICRFRDHTWTPRPHMTSFWPIRGFNFRCTGTIS